MKKMLLLIACTLSLWITPTAQGEGAKIRFDNTLHNFEVVAEDGGCVSHAFVFTNTGDAPLVIIDVSTNCGCTTAQYPQAPLVPGEQGTIDITFNPQGNPGEFAKEIIVKSNANKKKTRLHIKGVVVPNCQ